MNRAVNGVRTIIEGSQDAFAAGFQVVRFFKAAWTAGGNQTPRRVVCTLNHFDYPQAGSIKTLGVITLADLASYKQQVQTAI